MKNSSNRIDPASISADFQNEVSIIESSSIIAKEISKSSIELSNIFMSQLRNWSEYFDVIVLNSDSKADLLYLVLFIVELRIKYFLCARFSLSDFSYKFTFNNEVHTLDKVGHKVFSYLEKIIEMDQVTFGNMVKLIKSIQITYRIEKEMLDKYHDFKYNHDKRRIIFEDNFISPENKQILEEVVAHARID